MNNDALNKAIIEARELEKETGERKFVINPTHGPNAGKYLIVDNPPVSGAFWNTTGHKSQGT